MLFPKYIHPIQISYELDPFCQPRSQGFSLEGGRGGNPPTFKGKALGTKLPFCIKIFNISILISVV